MPFKWTAESDNKILLGILSHLKDTNIRLDMDKIAAFVGPDVTTNALSCRIGRLKKLAEGSFVGNGDFTTPTTSPQKRKGTPRTPAKKKQKNIPDERSNSVKTSLADQPRVVINLENKKHTPVKAEQAKTEKIKAEKDLIVFDDSDEVKEFDIKAEEEDKQDIKAESDDADCFAI
ncbi:hypothetical protein PENANT_c012G00924 [Penicillium antarcticum]|uniref:Uncharacterized protein n=1 Tax=Penicillium antarcticum TaxID=416450 RepID=A0A1V6Q686_9EURO|nr:uncharacterized protein N7508_008079 [Penicillium antarcticum]KAJ5297830.1 hypothetical protein N7508_008079 [Penicillium antarcticum]OQD84750.1 hypothetical protein PENANT_c012G00924 [Penicillium antarcticum]